MGRLQTEELILVDRMILETGGLEELKKTILQSPMDRASVLLKLALKRGMISDLLSNLVKEGKHHAVRRLALKTILDSGFAWKADGHIRRTNYDLGLKKDDFAEVGLSDRSVDVQRVALQYVLNHPDSRLHRKEVFLPFMSSSHISLADNAAFGLKKVIGTDNFLLNLIEQLRNDEEPPFWVARLVARYGDALGRGEIRTAYERLSVQPDLAWLELMALFEDRTAIEDLLRIALEHDDLHFAQRAATALTGKAFQPEFEAISAIIKRGKGEFEARGLRRLIDKCSTLDIVRTIVQLSIHEPTFDLENLWRLVGKKRQLRAFFPSRKEIEQLERELSEADPEIKTSANAELGLNNYRAF
jgi:hypothetical protein